MLRHISVCLLSVVVCNASLGCCIKLQAEIVSAIQEIMEANEERVSGGEDLIEMQLKKARDEIAALQEDKERLSQVKQIVYFVIIT